VLWQQMWQQMVTAASAFSATNVDDIVILTLLFSRRDSRLRPWQVVSGQVLGFALLLLVSLAGFLGQGLLEPRWLALLGLLPVSMGVSQLVQASDDDEQAQASGSAIEFDMGTVIGRGGSLVGVAALTVANGSDNIGVYMPMFSQSSAAELGVTLVTFSLGIALWCVLALRLSRAPGLARVLQRHGERLVAPVLIGIGLLILWEGSILEQREPAVIAIACLLVMAASLLHQLQGRTARID